MIKYYSILGYPVSHSRSPEIYNYLFRQHGLTSTYARLSSLSASGAIKLMKQYGISGFNVTSPYKQHAYQKSRTHDDAAMYIGAANTYTFRRGKLWSENTDPMGMLNSLKGLSLPRRRRVLLLGAGSAAGAAIYALKSMRHITLTIAARNIKKAKKRWHRKTRGAHVINLQNIIPEEYNIVINTLPGTVSADIINTMIKAGCIVIDANYNTNITTDNGIYINGKKWLVGQAFNPFLYYADDIAGIEEIEKGYNSFQKRGTDNIYLTGFMGSGKSTIGAELAQGLAYSFYDTDEIVSDLASKSINEIFNSDGESAFREYESQALSIASEQDSSVIACGGGALQSPANRVMIRSTGYNIMLLVKKGMLAYRLRNDTDRPLWSPGKFESRLQQRWDNYFRSSDLIVDANTSVQKLTAQIINELENYSNV